jgi:hypothetical protein
VFGDGDAEATPSVQQVGRPTIATSLGTKRDETITFARLRETRGGPEVGEETIDEVENRPDLAESTDVAREPAVTPTHS